MHLFLEENIKLFICFFILLTSLSTQAADRFISARAMGMGNAFTAVVDDSDAIYFNPAGIGKIRGINWTVMDPLSGLGGVEAAREIRDVASVSESSFVDIFDEIYGQNVWLGLGMKSLFSHSSFIFGVYGVSDLNIFADNPVSPELSIGGTVDYGLVFGGAIPIGSIADIGAVVKRITRFGVSVPFGASILGELNTTAISDKFTKAGEAWSLDLGLNFYIPAPGVNPTLSFVWRDVGQTRFRTKAGASMVPGDQDEMMVGAGLDFDLGVAHIRPAMDVRYLNRNDMQLGKKINMGLEISLPLFDIRTGFHQGYWSYGASFSVGLARFDAAVYSVELGEYPGQLEDKRYMVQMVFELGFDPSLDFIGSGHAVSSSSGSNGARHRGLKQRR